MRFSFSQVVLMHMGARLAQYTVRYMFVASTFRLLASACAADMQHRSEPLGLHIACCPFGLPTRLAVLVFRCAEASSASIFSVEGTRQPL